jgi:RimJ/RimL family protein N-acetyltransferase
MLEETMIILETEHLLFQPLTSANLDDLATLYADPEVMRFLGGPRRKDEVQHILNRYIQELWALVFRNHSEERSAFYWAVWAP